MDKQGAAGAGELDAQQEPASDRCRALLVPGEYKDSTCCLPAETRVLRSEHEIDEIRGVWACWPGHRDSDVDYFLDSLRSRPGARPHVLVLSRAGQPDAILVGKSERKPIDFKVGYLELARPLARVLTFANGALRGNASAENSGILISEIMKSLRLGEADVAVLTHVRADEALRDFTLQSTGWLSRDRFPAVRPHWGLNLPGNVEALHRNLSRKARQTQRWRAKKLEHDYSGRTRIQCFREPADLQRLFSDVETVAQKSYQRGLGVGFVDGPQMRQRLRLAAQKGWLRAYVLYVDERPWSFLVTCLYQGTLYCDFTGYDPQHRKYGPGSLLVTKVIEDCCQGGLTDEVTKVDFGPGDQQWKVHFSNAQWLEGPVYLFAPTLRGFGINLLRTSTVLLDRLTRKALDQTGLSRKIKRTWRLRALEEPRPE